MNPYQFKTLVWHRRARKTTTAITEVIRQAAQYPGTYWHVFPTYAEAKNVLWRDPNMLFRILPEQWIIEQNKSELIVVIKTKVNKQHSIIHLKGADKPERLRGENPIGVVLDEFAYMKPETWTEIVQPVLRVNDGWCWFVGTPCGKNHLYTLYQLGLKTSNWYSSLLNIDNSGILTQDQIHEAHESMTAQDFAQEFMCDFLESEGVVFRGVRGAMTAIPQEPKKDHLYVMGVDLAKVTDYTVLTVYDRMNNSQVYQDRFQTLEWPYQKSKITAVAKHYNSALVGLDATGLGDPVADDLIRSGLAVEPIKFTEPIKKELIEKLSIWIEQKKCKLLPIDESKLEFDNFSYEIGATGKVRYNAREGFHDDIVISHSLAVHLLQEVVKEEVTPESTRLQKAYRAAVENLEHGFNPEDEW